MVTAGRVGAVLVAFDMARTNRAVRNKYIKGLAIILFFVGLIVFQNVTGRRDKLRLLPYIEQWNALREFVAIVPISALTGRGIELLVDELRRALPPGPPLFPDDTLTDSSERTLVAERIREQLCLQTKKELPYASAVTVDGWEERKGTHGAKAGERLAVVIHATIHVEKPNQKLIVIGEKGSRIREIGTAARQDIAALLGCPVHLELFVRVDEEWSHSRAGLRDMGYTPSHERRA